jgi:hypothetical protein
LLYNRPQIVWREDREIWEEYTSFDPDRKWYQQGRQYQMDLGLDDIDTQPQVETEDQDLDLSSGIANHIYQFRRDDPAKAMISPKNKPFYLPVWQVSLQRILNMKKYCRSLTPSFVAIARADITGDKTDHCQPEQGQHL